MADLALHQTAYGEPDLPGPPVVFCHGLFGQGRNWTGVGKALAATHRVVLLDMPHHGRSPWSEDFDYVAMAEQVAAALTGPSVLVGHSMGGKAAMLVALLHPGLVERLCVVDISPVDYPPAPDFADFLRAMRGVDLDVLQRRGEATEAMRELVPDDTVRGFLLQNLRRTAVGDDVSWSWRMNLDVLGDALEDLASWPADRLPEGASYDGPVLWVGGAESAYVRDDFVGAMTALFPRVRRVTIKRAGHWVHSEQPAVFLETLRRFLP